MSRIAYSLLPLLLSLSASVAAQEERSSAPVETVSMVYVVVFGVIFVGMIVGFFVYLFMTDKKAPEENK